MMKLTVVLIAVWMVLVIGMPSVIADDEQPQPVASELAVSSEDQFIAPSEAEELIEQASSVCRALCNSTAAAGAAACAALSGAAYFACLAAVEVAREKCLDEC